MQAYSYLDSLWQRGKDFLGVKVPILGGAMTWVSERYLVSAISNAGGFGVIACGAMEPHHLDQEIGQMIDERLDAALERRLDVVVDRFVGG